MDIFPMAKTCKEFDIRLNHLDGRLVYDIVKDTVDAHTLQVYGLVNSFEIIRKAPKNDTNGSTVKVIHPFGEVTCQSTLTFADLSRASYFPMGHASDSSKPLE